MFFLVFHNNTQLFSGFEESRYVFIFQRNNKQVITSLQIVKAIFFIQGIICLKGSSSKHLYIYTFLVASHLQTISNLRPLLMPFTRQIKTSQTSRTDVKSTHSSVNGRDMQLVLLAGFWVRGKSQIRRFITFFGVFQPGRGAPQFTGIIWCALYLGMHIKSMSQGEQSSAVQSRAEHQRHAGANLVGSSKQWG